MSASMLLLAFDMELPPERRVWGTGGWQPPEEREALDWLTLARLQGWGVSVARNAHTMDETTISCHYKWIVVASDPDCLTEEAVALLLRKLETDAILVLARADTKAGALARLAGAAQAPERVSGRSLYWTGPGPGRNWTCRKPLEASALEVSEGTRTWATLDGAPIVVARQVSRGVVATLAFHPSHARDQDGAATVLLKHLLIWGSVAPVAWLDMEGTLVLRMDDPGGAQSVYNRSWCYPKLGEPEWDMIGAILRQRDARLSIGYVSGWVDDGDPERGILKVQGNVPRRLPGRVYPSPLVRYQDRAGHTPGTLFDGEAEYRGIQSLRAAGLGDVELHGYTHMHPDTEAWVKAPDRYETWPQTSWYRELGKAAEPTINARPAAEHPLTLGIKAFHRFFHEHPTTLIAPGDQWNEGALERALDLGLNLMSSYYLALRDNDRFVWAQHVCAPYLDEPDAAWFVSGLPLVGYFHDFELSTEGVDWMSRWLDRWHSAGARRLLDFRELAGALGRRLCIHDRNGELHLTVHREGSPALVRPLPILIRVPNGTFPRHLSVSLDRNELSLNVDRVEAELGRISLFHESEGTVPL